MKQIKHYGLKEGWRDISEKFKQLGFCCLSDLAKCFTKPIVGAGNR